MDKRIVPLLFLLLPLIASAQHDTANSSFTIRREGNYLSGISNTGDKYATNYIRKGQVFGDLTLHTSTPTNALTTASAFELKAQRLLWTITLTNTGTTPVTIDDLAMPLPYNSGGGENPQEIFEQHVVKHHFISGDNSFLFWERPTGVGPYLVMVPAKGTHLEYFSTAAATQTPNPTTTQTPNPTRGQFRAFIHAKHSIDEEKRGTWRQPATTLTLQPGQKHRYQFVFRWADDYQGVRNIIIAEGGIDIKVMPGMTVPSDLPAAIALTTHQQIRSIKPEFPQSTTIQKRPNTAITHQPNTSTFDLQFEKLGENRLTIEYGDHQTTYLEFFVTEPLETLYKKRAAFIVNRQQHKDSTKWYDGLFSVYDMKHHTLRGPDNPDYFDTSRLSYVLTCDDPALDKAPFVAAKNIYYPDQHEIDAVEYYIRHFVWGGLQRTEKETPYPYGVYGTPSWKVNRDTTLRKANKNDRNKDKMHVWRSYDYPHIVMLYYSLYKIAKANPGMTHYLDAKGYLIRAKETAKAFFTYPYEILPWYETYKWGCYNELLLVPLMEDLEKEGYKEDATFLRNEWEKKVKYFIYDDPYPFRSEYAIDATAFESTQALARYGALHTMQPDSNGWFDKNLKRWYSHPNPKRSDALDFMQRQMAANLALRGTIEPAYYYLGSDYRGRSDNFTLTYMSQMGGWSILDYALHFSTPAEKADYIRLGYASYLSAFALINSGTAGSNYGFWYPGKDNDGASGWAFESQQYANTWIQKAQGRGPWYYDGETDLGYGGALRTAATIVTDDPVFGWTAYGGKLTQHNPSQISVIPRDGLRTRLYIRSNRQNLDLELRQDGFAKEQPVVITPTNIRLRIENRSRTAHTTTLLVNNKPHTISVPAGKTTPTTIPID